MPITYAYAQGRCVYGDDNRLIRAFPNATQALAFALAVISGEVRVERRV